MEKECNCLLGKTTIYLLSKQTPCLQGERCWDGASGIGGKRSGSGYGGKACQQDAGLSCLWRITKQVPRTGTGARVEEAAIEGIENYSRRKGGAARPTYGWSLKL